MTVGIKFAMPFILLLMPLMICFLYRCQRRLQGMAAWRRRTILALRATLFCLLILALAGFTLRYQIEDQAVMFVVDASASTETMRPQVEEFLREAVRAKDPNDWFGIVTFGREALVELPATQRVRFDHLEAIPNKHYSNLAAGLRLASAVMPAAAQKRIVLLTDGKENRGDAYEQAGLLAAQGIRLDVVPLQGPQQGAEVLLKEIRIPSQLYVGETFAAKVSVQSTVRTTATLYFYVDRDLLQTQRVNLQPGENNFTFAQKADGAGFHTYRAVVNADADTNQRNNEVFTFSNIQGTPQILLVEGAPGEGTELAKALRSTGLNVQVTMPALIPPTLEELRSYQSVILCNVPAMALDEQTMRRLEVFVRDLGQGLVMVGGEESYGLGGYFKTPIERVLPVYMDLRGKGEIPSLGLVLIIDKSGSMGADQWGQSKMELAKEAAIQAAAVLQPQDQVGVVAFDEAAKWVVETQKVTNVAAIQDDIGTIRAGGGTNIYPALAMGFESLRDADTKLKHMILLTDGQSAAGGDYEALTAEMRKAGVTLTTVAVGSDADTLLLEELAHWGKGRYYFTDDFETIPRIFTKETFLATRTYLVNRDFTPVVDPTDEILSGLVQAGVPNLQGYIATTPKERADILISSDNQEPVLAKWQYGLGRSVAWTSDTKGRWSRQWLGWRDYNRFWANVIGWTLPQTGQGELRVETALTENGGRIDVEVPVAIATGEANALVIDPSLQTRQVPLQLVAPGRYTGEFPADQVGSYLIQVNQVQDGKTVAGKTTGLVVPYSPEYQISGERENFLAALAKQGNGAIIHKPTQAFADNLPPAWGNVPMQKWLLMLAIIILLFDIALRRLQLSPGLAVWFKQSFRRVKTDNKAEVVTTISRLQARKAKWQQDKAELQQGTGPLPVEQPGQTAKPQTPPAAKPVQPNASVKSAPAKDTAPLSEQTGGDTFARLRAAKRRAQQKQDDNYKA